MKKLLALLLALSLLLCLAACGGTEDAGTVIEDDDSQLEGVPKPPEPTPPAPDTDAPDDKEPDGKEPEGGEQQHGEDDTPTAPQGPATVYVDQRVCAAWQGLWVYGYADDGGNNGDWPGAALTEANDKGYLTYELPEVLQGKTAHLIIHNNVGEGTQGDVRVLIDVNANEHKAVMKTENDQGWALADYTDSAEAVGAAGPVKFTGKPAEPPKPSDKPSEPADPSAASTVYIDPRATASWQGVWVYGYADDGTNNGDWPGAAMTGTNAKGYYEYKLADSLQGKTAHLIIHNNVGEGKDGDIRILVDINAGETKAVDKSGGWVSFDLSKAETVTDVPQKPKGDATVYIDPAVTASWQGVWVYGYADDGTNNGDWPGTDMSELDGDGYYAYKLSDTLQGKTAHIIIHNNVGEGKDGDIRILVDLGAEEHKAVVPTDNEQGWDWVNR